tara:strand:- start:16424 stop:17539 length:1116 start_codon:yes stop_codon:yes gene_type:complete
MTRRQTSRPAAASLATMLAATLLLTGCATTGSDIARTPVVTDDRPLSELTLYPDPSDVEGPTTAVLPNEAIEPIAVDPTVSLPVTVTSYDSDGEVSVEVADASRVLALDLAGSIAATVWGLGLGDRLVGRDTSTTFEGTADLPLVTSSGHTINAEAVIALRPTLVLTDGTIGPRDVLEQLRQVGVTVVFLDNEPTFDGAAQLARDVGSALGAPAAGEVLAAALEAEVAATVAEIAEILPADEALRPRVIFLYLRGSSGIYYLFGEGSGADELIAGLGGIDVAAELGWSGERPMTDEALIAADPDVILVMTDGLESVGGVDALLAAKPAIALTHAGQNRRFVDMADGDVLSFGPRSAAVLDALARAVYAVPS